MASYKFMIILGVVLIGLSSQQGISTLNYNTCSNLNRMPNYTSDCTIFANSTNLCCYFNMTMNGTRASACYSIQTLAWTTNQNAVMTAMKSIAPDGILDCGYSSFLTVSTMLLVLFALLF